MGNCFSTSRRHCGLCYFELDEESTSLVEPSVQRCYTWRETSRIRDEEREETFDAQLPFPLPEAWREFLRIQIQTKLKTFLVSRQRGCRGCELIVKAIESACKDDGVFLDNKSWEEIAQVAWTTPSERAKDLSSLKIDLTVNVSAREAQSHLSEQYHLWTILIDIDKISKQGQSREFSSTISSSQGVKNF